MRTDAPGWSRVPATTVYTDEHRSCIGLPFGHESVKHSVGEFVRGPVHTNSVKSFWSTLKRAHKGTFHKLRETP